MRLITRLAKSTVSLSIDIRDYINGIGNCSHEPYISAQTVLLFASSLLIEN